MLYVFFIESFFSSSKKKLLAATSEIATEQHVSGIDLDN